MNSPGFGPAPHAGDMPELDRLIEDDEASGVFEMSREIFTSQRIFDLEMEHLFERGWSFLAFESQLPSPFDYYCTTMGRQPVILSRDGEGRVHAFINSCRHKGARLCHTETGNAEVFVCPYHAWTYDATGANRGIKDRKTGEYSPAFEAQDHDLVRLRVGIYRGLVFGGLGEDAPPLEEFLGGTRWYIDMVMDQGARGMELVPGRSRFRYEGNWKLQAENGTDLYHLTSTHTSFMKIVTERKSRGTDMASIRSRDFTRTIAAEAGVFSFPHGHVGSWIENHTPEQKPLNLYIDEVRARVGEERARWMLNFRNLVMFPNLQLADAESLLLRVIRPVSVDRTDVELYCLAPVGEPREARRLRIRQHEDFFNASGLATPDDAVVYEDCQFGHRTAIERQQGYGRGMQAMQPGGNEVSELFDIRPDASFKGSFRVQPEIQYRGFYRAWRAALQAGIARRGAGR